MIQELFRGIEHSVERVQVTVISIEVLNKDRTVVLKDEAEFLAVLGRLYL